MGRVMAGDFPEGVGKHLHLLAPGREKELSAAIRARAGELAEAGEDMAVDQPSEGALGIGAAVLASFETLLPLFDGDERRTVRYLRLDRDLAEARRRLTTNAPTARGIWAVTSESFLVRHSGVRMPWILGLDGTTQGREIVEALCRSCPGLAERTDPDPADRSGVVVCRATAPGLLEVLATARDAGSHVIVVVRSLPSVDPWQLLVAGAADVVPWQGDPRPVGARLARVDEVERIVDSAQVTDVILGDSPALRDALRELVTAARFGAGPILILGETGTGKELAARVAHAVGGAGGRGTWSRSTARRSCRPCPAASCSGTSGARSPAPSEPGPGHSRPRTAAR